MRRFLLFFAISMVPPALLAQSVPHITITDNGSVFIRAGNFDGDGGGDIVSEDSNGNLDCVPSDGGKYDLGVIVSPVQFPGSPGSVATATLKSGASDYVILGGDGIVNLYSSSNCIFTFSQSLIIEGSATDVFVTPPLSGNGGVYVTVFSAVAGQSAFTFYSQIFQNSNGTLSPGPPGLGPGAEGSAAGSSIAIANFVEPQPPGAYSTFSVSLWTYANGAWTSTPSFTPPGLPGGFLAAPQTQALYLVSHDSQDNINIQEVNPSSGAASAPVSYDVGALAFDMGAFNGDSFAIALGNGVQIFQDSSGSGTWAPLGSQIFVTIPGVIPGPTQPAYRSWVGMGASVPGGFALQSPDGTATVFTVQNGPMVSVQASLNFPPTGPGSSSSLPLTLTNTGNAPLTVTGVAFSGTNAADFSQTNNCTAVAPKASCIITALFTPSTLSAESAAMAIGSNASNSPTSVSLATAPAPAPIISVSSTTLDFGTVTVNSTATKTLVIGNSGSAPLNDFAVQVSGGGFALTNNPCPTLLAVLAQCSIIVSFTPASPGSVNGTLTITSNISPVTVPLQGTGSAAAAVTATPPALSASSGGTSTAQITFSNFTTTPTITASCQIPAGSCTIQNNSELIVTTTARSWVVPANDRVRWDWPATSLTIVLIVAMLWMITPRRRRVVLVFAGSIMFAACGGGGGMQSASGTPAGTYNVLVTGTAGAVTQSITVPVTVN
jgi:hypothetical protein